jgi:hypothetical protein
MNGEHDVDGKLAELGARTAALRARTGFEQRVLLAIQADTAHAYDRELLRSARFTMPFAAFAAVVALVWAVTNEFSTNQALAVSQDPVELSW